LTKQLAYLVKIDGWKLIHFIFEMGSFSEVNFQGVVADHCKNTKTACSIHPSQKKHVFVVEGWVPD